MTIGVAEEGTNLVAPINGRSEKLSAAGAQQAKVHNNILYYLGSDGTGINRNTFLYAVQLPTDVPLWHQLVSHAIFMIPGRFFVANGIASVTDFCLAC
jgi:hypothetical protein